MSNLISFAEQELALIGGQDDDMQKLMNSQILEIVKTFAGHGHSGFSANYAANIIDKLLRYEPLKPLTGADDEWNDCGDVWQNKRCSRVFKDKQTGRAYDIEGKVFREPDGLCFTSGDSHVDVTFPYTPKREYVDVEAATNA